MPYELPTPDLIAEEPLRPLLATVQAATHNLLCALYVESPESFPTVVPRRGMHPDPAVWTAAALAQAIEHLHEVLGLHDQALIDRNTIRDRPEHAC